MVSGQIPDLAFEIVKYVFSGRCAPYAGGFENKNEKPYMWFDDKDLVYLKTDEQNLPDEVIADDIQLYNYILTHRNMQDTAQGSDYPVYVIGGYAPGDTTPLGRTLFLIDTVNLVVLPIGCIIYTWLINQRYPQNWEKLTGAVLVHELGHHIMKIGDEDSLLHTRTNCIMYKGLSYSLVECEATRFCTFCIYMLRGNIYRLGRPVFSFSNEKRSVR